MFQFFTEKAIKILILAQDEARLSGHNFLGTEQLFLGILREGSGFAAQALMTKNITVEKARADVLLICGQGTDIVEPPNVPFTPRSKRVLELAWDEAKIAGVNYIGTEHLLLGLLREGEGVAVKVLEGNKIDLSELRQIILQLADFNPERSSD